MSKSIILIENQFVSNEEDEGNYCFLSSKKTSSSSLFKQICLFHIFYKWIAAFSLYSNKIRTNRYFQSIVLDFHFFAKTIINSRNFLGFSKLKTKQNILYKIATTSSNSLLKMKNEKLKKAAYQLNKQIYLFFQKIHYLKVSFTLCSIKSRQCL